MMKRQLLSRFITKISIFTVVYIVVLLAFDLYFDGFIIDIVEAMTNGYYIAQSVMEHKVAICLFIYTIVLFIIAYNTIKKAQKNFIDIYMQIEKVLIADDEIDPLPNELKDIEVRLKDIKYTVFRNEQVAREAEQRKNDLVVYLAHDLKTPLTSVIGYLSLLEECPELPEKMRAKYTSIALNKSYRLEQLINEFFDITRFNLQSVALENNRIDLSMMLNQMVEEFYPILAEKHLRPKLSIDPGIKMIGDADKLARVFDNLLRNAANYSYPNTTVYISAREEEDYVEIVFKNSGDKIPDQKLETIFEKFFRIDSSRSSSTGGAGLGLAIAKQIVELHGGVIKAHSDYEFTEFIVNLPKNLIKL